MRHEIRHKQAGFSLAELMVAMVMTLLVTGAIFGLLSSGQSAFKVQPERTERQQNIRTSMDLITRDAASAGVGMPPFVQTFTPGLDGVGTTTGPSGANTDEIEILANTDGFANEPGCHAPGDGNSADIRLTRGTTNLSVPNIVMIFFKDGTWTVRNIIGMSNPNSGSGQCIAGNDHVQLNVRPGGDTSGLNVASGSCQPSKAPSSLGNAGDPLGVIPPSPACNSDEPCCQVDSVGFGSMVHYRIRPDATETDDAGVFIPNLERSVNGQAFQVVARGVEDLQVGYLNQADQAAGALPRPNAPAVDGAGLDFTTLITQVRVTLTTRAATRRLQGATTSAAGGAALRGSLSSQATPRQALATLTTELIAPKWN